LERGRKKERVGERRRGKKWRGGKGGST